MLVSGNMVKMRGMAKQCMAHIKEAKAPVLSRVECSIFTPIILCVRGENYFVHCIS
jgi:hypothetical protein